MRRYQPFDPPEYFTWQADAELVREFNDVPRRDAKAAVPSQFGGLGFGLAGFRRRRIRNPGSLLSFS